MLKFSKELKNYIFGIQRQKTLPSNSLGGHLTGTCPTEEFFLREAEAQETRIGKGPDIAPLHHPSPHKYQRPSEESPLNFDEDIRQHVLANLPYASGYAQKLAALDPHELLIIYKNWLDRLVRPVPRAVHCSSALKANPLASDPAYKAPLEQIIEKLKTGTDVTPHLSRSVRIGYQPDTARKQRQDLDLLLNDWGVYHLHLSTKIERYGFVERTGPLLFAMFRPADAYLIEIVPHGGWTRDRVMQIVAKDWPGAGLVHEMKGVTPPSMSLSEQDRKVLRNKHVNAFFECDGKVYSPTSGLTTAGTSVTNTFAVIQIFKDAAWFCKKVEENPSYVSATLMENGIEAPENVDLHFTFFHDGGYGIVESQTGFRFPLR